MDNSASTTDNYLAGITDLQPANLRLFRELIHTANPDISEQIKWGVPVFMRGRKLVFSMASFKAHTKFNFIANGAALEAKKHLFNNGLESKKSRSIDLQVGQSIDRAALANLITQAIAKL